MERATEEFINIRGIVVRGGRQFTRRSAIVPSTTSVPHSYTRTVDLSINWRMIDLMKGLPHVLQRV